jgi:hypothetical protein
VDEGDVWVLHLAVAAFPTELAHGLDAAHHPEALLQIEQDEFVGVIFRLYTAVVA